MGALKTKHDTPKYGLIYHAQLVSQTTTALKGKVSRMLAAKASLACRVDAFSEDTTSSIEMGMEQRLKVEARINQLEGGNRYRVSGTGKEAAKFDKYESKGEVLQYKTAADNTIAAPKKRKLIEEISGEEPNKGKRAEDSTEEQKKKKKVKDNEGQQEEKVEGNETVGGSGDIEKTKKTKEKDNKSQPEESVEESGEKEKTKKKKKEKHNEPQHEEKAEGSGDTEKPNKTKEKHNES